MVFKKLQDSCPKNKVWTKNIGLNTTRIKKKKQPDFNGHFIYGLESLYNFRYTFRLKGLKLLQ